MGMAEASPWDVAPWKELFPPGRRSSGSWIATPRGGLEERTPGSPRPRPWRPTDSPHEVGDDQKLNRSVDDPNGPTLHNHRLGGLVGEEI